LDSIPADVRRRAKLLVINYPNSPTGKTATPEFYAKVVEFALANQIVVVQDATHMMLSYDAPPLSFLQTPGARDVGIEIHSMSKGWNMIGWRLGWFCGNQTDRPRAGRREGQLRLGPVHGHSAGGGRGARRPEIPRRIRAKYRRRLEKLVATLRRCGFDCKMPGGSFFLYTRSPRRAAGGSNSQRPRRSASTSLTEHSICTVPWDDAGPYLRFSVTYEASDEAAEDALMAETEAAG